MLPLILALFLPLLYSLFAAPLFASSRDPDANTPSLQVLIVDNDGAFLGKNLTSYYAALAAAGSFTPNPGSLPIVLPTFSFAAGLDPAEVTRRVRDSEVWAAVTANAGASSRLTAALAAGTPGVAAYAASATAGPSSAFSVIWDEARQNSVSTARIAAPIKSSLPGLGLRIGLQLLTAGTISPAGLAACLGAPAYFTEVSLFPFTVPAVNQALAVGQILLFVFALVATNMIFIPLAAHPFIKSATPGASLAARRLALCVLFSGCVSAAYATILVGLAASGSSTGGGPYDGTMWARVWATQWLNMLQAVMWLVLLATAAGGPAIAGGMLAPLLIFNVISVNVDVADPGYKFFW